MKHLPRGGEKEKVTSGNMKRENCIERYPQNASLMGVLCLKWFTIGFLQLMQKMTNRFVQFSTQQYLILKSKSKRINEDIYQVKPKVCCQKLVPFILRCHMHLSRIRECEIFQINF